MYVKCAVIFALTACDPHRTDIPEFVRPECQTRCGECLGKERGRKPSLLPIIPE